MADLPCGYIRASAATFVNQCLGHRSNDVSSTETLCSSRVPFLLRKYAKNSGVWRGGSALFRSPCFLSKEAGYRTEHAAEIGVGGVLPHALSETPTTFDL